MRAMSKRLSPEIRDHLEWLGFIQPTGLVVSAHALEQAGAILNRRDVEGQRKLAECVEERSFAGNEEREPCLPDFEAFARRVLGWRFSPKGFAGNGQIPIPEELELALPEYGETLRPDFAVRERHPDEGSTPWQLLVQVVSPETNLDRTTVKRGGLEASAHGRLERLLRETRVPAGLLFNGRVVRLLSAPRGESSGWMDFRVNDMLPTAGRPLCAALRLLLSEQRLLALPKKERLAGLLEASRKYQNVVSERLSEQVLHGLYELLRGFQSAHEKWDGKLLEYELEQNPDNVYRALLTVMLRLVFLLYAEERGMLSDDATFTDHYSIGRLWERLREDAGLHPDTMDDRYGAWAQLLVLFRMVHDGAKSEGMELPERRGGLFDPSRFPFLEGWRGSEAPQRTQAIDPPLVPDGTIYRVLDKLLVLDGERISYRALDVEQIGSVYETMMGFRLETATGRSVAIKAQKRGGASTTVDLEKLLEVGPAKRAKWIRDRTDRKLTPKVTKSVETAGSVAALHAALGTVVDLAATPDLVPRGAMILQPSDERRRSGSHYTPRELTAPIVEKTLEPILGRLGNGGVPKPEELLDLKVCDPAMGSGAFLVETCRYLAEQLLEAWKVYDGHPQVLPEEDEVVLARRMVAQRCLYGVDRNPMAVDLAKMSLWLATLSRDEPLTFVDHALRDGDSLVGLTRRQIAAFTWKKGALSPQLELNTRVADAIGRVRKLRREIRVAGPSVTTVELEDKLHESDVALMAVRYFGDLALEAFFLKKSARDREKQRQSRFQDLQDREKDREHWQRLAQKRRAPTPFAPFHWEIEFPEVFDRENPGFDAFVGNPPFAGHVSVVSANIAHYTDWLRSLHPETVGKCDVVAHFFRRAFSLLRDCGTMGLIATNTIGQGGTRGTGLRWICHNGGEIYRAFKRYRWPGQAAVVVSIVHVLRGESLGSKQLDGRPVEKVTAFLFHTGGHDDPVKLKANEGQSFQGSIVLGMGFTFDDTHTKGVASPLSEMRRLIEKDSKNGESIFPYIGGQEVNTSPTHSHHRYVINFKHMPLRRTDLGRLWRVAGDEQRKAWLREGIVPVDYPDPVAADWPDLLKIIEERVKPERLKAARKSKSSHAKRAAVWWQIYHQAQDLYTAIRSLDRVLAISRVGQQAAFALLSKGMVYAESLILFPLDTHAAFCALQSRPHEIWARFFGSTLEERLRYTPSDVFGTFPFPHNWTAHPSFEAIGQAYYDFRAGLMVQNDEGLTKTYNRFHDPEERAPEIAHLRELHAAMDRAVLDAYGWTDVPTECEFFPEHKPEENEAASGRRRRRYRYRWSNSVQDEVLGRLVELNAERAEEEHDT